jgi:hypothetical protein
VELVERLVDAEGCRREVLEEYLDGLTGQACEEGDEKCDRCERGAGEETGEGVDQEVNNEIGEEVDEEVDEEIGEEVDEEVGEEVGDKADEESDIEGGTEIEELMIEMIEREEVDREERREIVMQLRRQERQGRREAERIQKEGLELEELEELLRRAKGRCANCVQEERDNDDHLLFSCREASSQEARKVYQRMKEKIRQGRTMEKYSGCMECFLPQAWCNQWEQRETDGGMYRRKVGVKCEFQDVVLSGFVVGVMDKEGAMEGLRDRMAERGYDVKCEDEGLKYLGQKRIWGGLETSVLLREYSLMG